MKYCVDFDRTLFNTDAFVAQVKADGHLSKLISTDIWHFYSASDFLYEDVGPFLKSKSPNVVTIVTAITPGYGEQSMSYQRAKVEQNPVRALVREIIFVENDKGEAVAKIAEDIAPETPLVFIDDRFDQCLSVKKAVPSALCFLIIREFSLVGVFSNITDIYLVNSLTEVDAKIKLL